MTASRVGLDDAPRRHARSALTVAVVATVYWTLAPFEAAWGEPSSRGGPELTDRLVDAVERPLSTAWIAHVVVFGILGLLAGWSRFRWLGEVRPRLAVRLTLVAAILELAQFAVADRHPRLGDWLLNSAALAVGAGFASRRVDRFSLACRLHAGALQAAWRATFVVVALLAAAVSGARYAGGALDDWDARFPLAVGDEPDGSRPWRGSIRHVALFAHELTPTDVRRLATATPTTGEGAAHERTVLGARLVYDFAAARSSDRGIVVPEAGQHWGDLELVGLRDDAERVPAPVAGWLDVGGARLVTPRSLVQFCYHVAASDAFSVEVDARPDDVDQLGPARIVSISEGPYRRNLTLGQDGGDLEVRVRCAATGWNGIEHRAIWPDVFVAGADARLTVTYGSGRVRLYRDGEPVGDEQSLVLAAAAATIGTSGGAVPLALLWFVPLGLALALGWRVRGRGAVVGGLLAAAPLALAEVWMATRTGHAPSFGLVLLGALVVGGLGAARVRPARRATVG